MKNFLFWLFVVILIAGNILWVQKFKSEYMANEDSERTSDRMVTSLNNELDFMNTFVKLHLVSSSMPYFGKNTLRNGYPDLIKSLGAKGKAIAILYSFY